MQNILLRISYDGSGFYGWQLQKSGERSVEETLLEVWASIAKGEKIKIIPSGRTDKGVHALEQAANFTTTKDIPAANVKKAFNSLLPKDIYVQSVSPVPPEFHARYDAILRTYLYKISKEFSLFDRFYAYYHPYPLDIRVMRKASLALLGEHDFSAFRSSGCFAKNPVRKMKEINISEDAAYLYFEFTANAFLFRMIRNIMGAMIAIGDGHKAVEEMGSILESLDRANAGKTAPACGLYLKKIRYENV